MSKRRERLAGLLDGPMLKRVVLANGLTCVDRRRISDLREAVVGATSMSRRRVLECLTCESLRRICKEHGAVATSTKKADLVVALLRASTSTDARDAETCVHASKAGTGTAAMPRTSRFVAIDFETANVSRNSACAVSLVVSDGVSIVKTYSSLIRPPSLDFQFTYIHGISAQDVRKAPSYADIHEAVIRHLHGAEFIAAHNASFDSSVLTAVCRHWKLQLPSHPWKCTVKMARQTWGIYPTKLPDVCRRLGITLQHHDALSDATACARIVLAAVASSPEAQKVRSSSSAYERV